MSLLQLPQVPITVRRVEKYRVTNFNLSQALNHRLRRAKREREYTVLNMASRAEEYMVQCSVSLIQLPQVPITVRRVEKYRVTNFNLSQALNHRARRAKHEREYTVLTPASRTEQYRVKWRRTVMALSKRKPGLDQHRVYRV